MSNEDKINEIKLMLCCLSFLEWIFICSLLNIWANDILDMAIPLWVGVIVGGIVGLVYVLAPGDDKPEKTT